MIYLVYRCSYLYGGALESATESREHLIDADTNLTELRDRVNAYFASPEQMRLERGKKHELPAFAMKSESMYSSGGGCAAQSWLEIRHAPTVKVKEELTQ